MPRPMAPTMESIAVTAKAFASRQTDWMTSEHPLRANLVVSKGEQELGAPIQRNGDRERLDLLHRSADSALLQ